MDFAEYQAFADATALYPELEHNMVYPAMGLSGEAGETCEKVKKSWRATGSLDSICLPPEHRLAILKEAGDCLWYIAALARELKSSIEEVALLNLEKLQSRRERGVIKSEGDDR